MNSNEPVRVEVSHWGESVNMWALLVDLTFDENGRRTGASRKEWFPKSICQLERIEPEDRTKDLPKYFLTAPVWLLDKKNVKYDKN